MEMIRSESMSALNLSSETLKGGRLWRSYIDHLHHSEYDEGTVFLVSYFPGITLFSVLCPEINIL